jgi:hypothetical protein
MKLVRFNEPKDPELLTISKVHPDRWLDDQWPRPRHQGRYQPLATSQLVRIHLLTLIKALGSFNRACKELGHNTDFRRFCRLHRSQSAPTPGYLCQFREDFGPQGWTTLHRHLLGAVAQLVAPSPLGLVVLDSTDLPAAVRRTSKKKTGRRWPNASDRPAPIAERAAARAASPIILSATRNTAPAG